MRRLFLAIVLLAFAVNEVQAQLVEILPINERVPTFTSDQIITGAVTIGLGGIVGTAVEDATNSRFLGVVSGAIVGGAVGYAKDRWDMKNNNAIPNKFAPYNDTLAGVLGGAIGANIKIRINFGGRKNSKRGFGGRYFKRRR